MTMTAARIISMSDSPIQRALKEPGLVLVIGECNSGKTVLGEWIAANRGGTTTDLNEAVRFRGINSPGIGIDLVRVLRHNAVVDGKVAVCEIALRRRMDGKPLEGVLESALAMEADVILHVENLGNHRLKATALKCRSMDPDWSFEFTVGPK